ncbi:hypothetical protein NWP18_13945, partial [Chrysosporum ovalisporum ANA283AFssAo]|nr:hypothetical protein [Umezakia ovalisporum ANA283AFssAo]
MILGFNYFLENIKLFRWVKWITQRSDLQVQDILNTEFQWIERESDVLLKVLSPEIGEFLLLNE